MLRSPPRRPDLSALGDARLAPTLQLVAAQSPLPALLPASSPVQPPRRVLVLSARGGALHSVENKASPDTSHVVDRHQIRTSHTTVAPAGLSRAGEHSSHDVDVTDEPTVVAGTPSRLPRDALASLLYPPLSSVHRAVDVSNVVDAGGGHSRVEAIDATAAAVAAANAAAVAVARRMRPSVSSSAPLAAPPQLHTPRRDGAPARLVRHTDAAAEADSAAPAPPRLGSSVRGSATGRVADAPDATPMSTLPLLSGSASAAAASYSTAAGRRLQVLSPQMVSPRHASRHSSAANQEQVDVTDSHAIAPLELALSFAATAPLPTPLGAHDAAPATSTETSTAAPALGSGAAPSAPEVHVATHQRPLPPRRSPPPPTRALSPWGGVAGHWLTRAQLPLQPPLPAVAGGRESTSRGGAAVRGDSDEEDGGLGQEVVTARSYGSDSSLRRKLRTSVALADALLEDSSALLKAWDAMGAEHTLVHRDVLQNDASASAHGVAVAVERNAPSTLWYATPGSTPRRGTSPQLPELEAVTEDGFVPGRLEYSSTKAEPPLSGRGRVAAPHPGPMTSGVEKDVTASPRIADNEETRATIEDGSRIVEHAEAVPGDMQVDASAAVIQESSPFEVHAGLPTTDGCAALGDAQPVDACESHTDMPASQHGSGLLLDDSGGVSRETISPDADLGHGAASRCLVTPPPPTVITDAQPDTDTFHVSPPPTTVESVDESPEGVAEVIWAEEAPSSTAVSDAPAGATSVAPLHLLAQRMQLSDPHAIPSFAAAIAVLREQQQRREVANARSPVPEAAASTLRRAAEGSLSAQSPPLAGVSASPLQPGVTSPKLSRIPRRRNPVPSTRVAAHATSGERRMADGTASPRVRVYTPHELNVGRGDVSSPAAGESWRNPVDTHARTPVDATAVSLPLSERRSFTLDELALAGVPPSPPYAAAMSRGDDVAATLRQRSESDALLADALRLATSDDVQIPAHEGPAGRAVGDSLAMTSPLRTVLPVRNSLLLSPVDDSAEGQFLSSGGDTALAITPLPGNAQSSPALTASATESVEGSRGVRVTPPTAAQSSTHDAEDGVLTAMLELLAAELRAEGSER